MGTPGEHPDVPGGVVRSEHPFAAPEHAREPLRRFRGRLSAPVTLWTAGAGAERAGLTVSSVLVAEPGHLLGLLGQDTDVLDALSATGRFAVTVLDWPHRALADAFSFLFPAPGGPFALGQWAQTPWGPVPVDPADPATGPDGVPWVGCRLRSTRPLGWSALVEADVEHVSPAEQADPLAWHRGRYRHLG